MREYNKKLSTTRNAYDNLQEIKNTRPSTPQLHTLNDIHPLSLVLRNYRNIALTEHISTIHSYLQCPVTHTIAQQPDIAETYEQIKEQSQSTYFRSQNNHLFSSR